MIRRVSFITFSIGWRTWISLIRAVFGGVETEVRICKAPLQISQRKIVVRKTTMKTWINFLTFSKQKINFGHYFNCFLRRKNRGIEVVRFQNYLFLPSSSGSSLATYLFSQWRSALFASSFFLNFKRFTSKRRHQKFSNSTVQI